MLNLTTDNLSIRINKNIICTKLNLKVEQGMCLGILGCNGSGKSTLLRTIAGLNKPKSGSININDTNINLISSKQKAKQIGILLQQNLFSFPSTVFETALVGRYSYTSFLGSYQETDIEIVIAALKYYGLSDKQNNLVSSLSGGESQRLALAIISIQNPKIYLLDEPLNNLDIKYHKLLQQKFDNTSNLTSIMVLHDFRFIKNTCSHLLLLKDGEHIFGTLDELYTLENLEWLYQTNLTNII